MAFIKRSTVTPVNVKVGKTMAKCSACGKPVVGATTLCDSCNKNESECPEESKSE